MKLVVFDLDGVLIDSNASHARAFQDLWARLGVNGPDYSTIAGMRTTEVVERVTAGRPATDQERREWVEFKQARGRQYLSEGVGLFPDVPDALGRLRDAGHDLAIGTGASRQTALWAIESAGIRPFFGVVVTADDVRAGKPAPDVFLEAMRQAGGRPEETLVVEDSAAGLFAADAAGAWSAGVRSGVVIASPRFVGAFLGLGSLVGWIFGRSEGRTVGGSEGE